MIALSPMQDMNAEMFISVKTTSSHFENCVDDLDLGFGKSLLRSKSLNSQPAQYNPHQQFDRAVCCQGSTPSVSKSLTSSQLSSRNPIVEEGELTCGGSVDKKGTKTSPEVGATYINQQHKLKRRNTTQLPALSNRPLINLSKQRSFPGSGYEVSDECFVQYQGQSSADLWQHSGPSHLEVLGLQSQYPSQWEAGDAVYEKIHWDYDTVCKDLTKPHDPQKLSTSTNPVSMTQSALYDGVRDEDSGESNDYDVLYATAPKKPTKVETDL